MCCCRNVEAECCRGRIRGNDVNHPQQEILVALARECVSTLSSTNSAVLTRGRSYLPPFSLTVRTE